MLVLVIAGQQHLERDRLTQGIKQWMATASRLATSLLRCSENKEIPGLIDIH